MTVSPEIAAEADKFVAVLKQGKLTRLRPPHEKRAVP